MKIFASILNANFLTLGKDIEEIERGGIDGFHLDVMDGHFVPNISLGTPIAQALRMKTDKIIDIHLMVYNPEKFVDYFYRYGEYITVHVETEPEQAIERIKKYGRKAGIALNPETDVKNIFPYIEKVELVLVMSVHPGFGGQKFIKDVLKKGKIIKKEREDLILAIDGGVNKEVIGEIINAGFDWVVIGSYITGAKDKKRIIEELKNVSNHH